MANLFNSVLQKRPRKNAFNLSHDVKLSLKFGKLVPVLLEECLPSDKFKGNCQVMLRMAPMLAPVMHKIDAYVHFFYVPNRILWDNWETFITGADETSEIEPPWFSFTSLDDSAVNSSLLDYLGFPSQDIDGIDYTNTDAATREDRRFNALPLAAYQRIWYEYYRDENLEFPDSKTSQLKLTNGNNPFNINNLATALGRMRYRNWFKDYFTSALPFAQKGAAAMIPLSGDIGLKDPWPNQGSIEAWTKVRHLDDGTPFNAAEAGNLRTTAGSGQLIVEGQSTAMIDSSEFYELSGSNTTVEDLRSAFRLQEWLERNARGGTRYIESIYSHFGSRVSDYRLDRPEYIGGKKMRIQISEVLQTAPPDDASEGGDTALATMAGHGISAAYSGGFNYTCQEHGFIIGIMSVVPRAAYFQGIPPVFGRRKDRLDYYWPSFANLGEQPIQNKELFYNGLDDEEENEGTFGYTPRYAEYRYKKSTVAGDFNTSLDFWHLARKFPERPELNQLFVNVANPDVDEDWDRIFAVQDGTDYLWAHVNFDMLAVRPMPRYATPIT